jgi:hypothetical protein
MACSRVTFNFKVTVAWSWPLYHMPLWLAQGQVHRLYKHVCTVIFQTTQRRTLGILINQRVHTKKRSRSISKRYFIRLVGLWKSKENRVKWSCPSRYSNRALPENKMHCRLSQVAFYIHIICFDREMRPVLGYVTYTPTTPTVGNFI